MSNNNYPIYELSPEEFESMCIELINAAEPGLHVSKRDGWIDATGERTSVSGARSVAIEVKHWRKFSLEGLRRFLVKAIEKDEKFDEYFFITSSEIQDHEKWVTECSTGDDFKGNFSLLGYPEIIHLLSENEKIAAKYFASAKKRITNRRLSIIIGTISLLISVLGLGNSLYFYLEKEPSQKTTLEQHILNVEKNLSGLKEIENDLNSLKLDLRNKKAEVDRITVEYEKAMKLKEITSEQLAQVKLAVASQSRGEIIFNYILGFIFGVAASILATVLTDSWKRRNALKDPEDNA